ncbi:ankyrin repeat-containing domain protein [Lactarius akahatsu]|uniref:Ankyrin repeat-containing domain protein n=1 Tax=Lactarius akahatsu TaxID=416441 RepID=A0AAD4LLF6_9AGAM|nr:ankyrin repeat-containing domain protein [Lactarius akahatsu]
MVRLQLDCGAAANLEVGLGQGLGRTLLHLVFEGIYDFNSDAARITELLLEHGADVNAQVHLASYFGNVKILRVLLDRGATANSKRKLGRTPLHLAAEGKHINGVRITDLLLEHGADVNAQDKDNTTPLHLASYCGRVKIARMLLDRGANANATNALGQTPLHMVSRGAYSSQEDGAGIAQVLLEHGADVNAQDKNHATPSDWASYHGRTVLASLFLHYDNKASANVDQGSTPRQLGVHLHEMPEHSIGTTSGACVRKSQLSLLSGHLAYCPIPLHFLANFGFAFLFPFLSLRIQ